MKKQLGLIVLAAILFGIGSQPTAAAQKHGRSVSTARSSRLSQLAGTDKLKEVFQGDQGKVRLVALLSPT